MFARQLFLHFKVLQRRDFFPFICCHSALSQSRCLLNVFLVSLGWCDGEKVSWKMAMVEKREEFSVTCVGLVMSNNPMYL